ncbi:MAG TPA: hypothetical protein IAC67_01750 [Candidatus Coproplasma excrementipullorum]|nr:hypothetical protein [Candidatus Coproplasma excrementipullorum]
MKVTKKLVTSIICLVLSLAFCVWAVFAWFSANNAVDAGGIQTTVQGNNLTMVVKAYYLTGNDDGSYTKGDMISVDGNGYFNMPRYSGFGGATTAVLLEVIIINTGTENKTLPLSVSCAPLPEDEGELLDYKNNTFITYLSNAVYISNATVSGDTCSAVENSKQTFLNTNSDPIAKNTVTLDLSLTITQGENTLYYIMDYDEDLMEYLNTLAVTNSGGALTSYFSFIGDLCFNLGMSGEEGSGEGGTTTTVYM